MNKTNTLVIAIVVMIAFFTYLSLTPNRTETIVPVDVTQTDINVNTDTSKGNETSEQKTVVSQKYAFSVKHPQDFVVSETNDAGFYNEQKLHSLTIKAPLTYEAGTDLNLASVNVTVSPTIKNCYASQGSIIDMTASKTINGTVFKYNPKQPMDNNAMGGQRGTISLFSTIYEKQCYRIEKSIGYRDLRGFAEPPYKPHFNEVKVNADLDSIISSFSFNQKQEPVKDTGSTSSTKPSTLPVNGRVRAPIDIVLAKGQTKTAMGLSVTLVSIDESRCPRDVQCVWAGKVTTSLKMTTDSGVSKTVSLDLGSKPITYSGYEISITDVKLLPKSGVTVSGSDYRVTVHVASSYTNIVDNPDVVQTDSTGKTCVNSGGTWDSIHRECGGISEISCKEIKGTWNECGSACRHNPKAEMCTLQCVQFCQL